MDTAGASLVCCVIQLAVLRLFPRLSVIWWPWEQRVQGQWMTPPVFGSNIQQISLCRSKLFSSTQTWAIFHQLYRIPVGTSPPLVRPTMRINDLKTWMLLLSNHNSVAQKAPRPRSIAAVTVKWQNSTAKPTLWSPFLLTYTQQQCPTQLFQSLFYDICDLLHTHRYTHTQGATRGANPIKDWLNAT